MSKTQSIVRALAPAIAFGAAVTCSGGATAASLSEDFAKAPGFASTGWSQKNNSTAPGSEPNWFQGDDGFPFTAQGGPGDSYLTVNYASVSAGSNQTISNWLISPTMQFNNGDVVSFYTKTEFREPSSGLFPDRLELRFSSAGGTNVGTSPTDVGTFTTLLTTVNPSLAQQGQPGAYPFQWTQYTAQIITGLPTPTNGAIAFRYFVTDGGPTGANSNSIALDTVNIAAGVAPVPEPAVYLMMALGLGVIGLRRMRAMRD